MFSICCNKRHKKSFEASSAQVISYEKSKPWDFNNPPGANCKKLTLYGPQESYWVKLSNIFSNFGAYDFDFFLQIFANFWQLYLPFVTKTCNIHFCFHKHNSQQGDNEDVSVGNKRDKIILSNLILRMTDSARHS